jgi:hypothetical protein
MVGGMFSKIQPFLKIPIPRRVPGKEQSTMQDGSTVLLASR